MASEQAFVASPIALGGGRIIASPFQFYATGEDRLRLITINSLPGVVVKMQWRLVDAAGSVQANSESQTPNSNRTTKTSDLELGVGSLLNLTVFASSGTPQMGQTFVMVQLVRGFGAAAIVLGTMLAGYVTSTQHLAWPGSPVQSSIEGPGAIRTIVGTQPAVGADISEAVPAGARWEALCVFYVLNTSAALGNRFPMLKIITPTAGILVLPPGPPTTDATSGAYSWGDALGTQGLQTSIYSSASLPASMPLPAASTITTLTQGMAAGDQLLAPVLHVREWLEAA